MNDKNKKDNQFLSAKRGVPNNYSLVGKAPTPRGYAFYIG